MDRELNESELVEILTSELFAVHRGLGKEVLLAKWDKVLSTGYTEGVTNPVDKYREEVMAFINTNREVLLPQFGCTGDCYTHPDSQVVFCWLQMKGEVKL